jgi:predicted dehydrogenase
VGHQGRWHAQKFAALPESTLIAVVDVDAERRKSLASELGVPAFDDYNDLIGEVDAVSIASPTSSHFEIASTFLKNNVHVLVEKPITTTLEEAADLVALAEKNKLVLQVGHLERFNPAVMAVGQLPHQPLFIESTRISRFPQRSLDISVVLDLMIHDIDLIHSIIGTPMINVDASGGPVISDDIDIANARIKFQGGCVANVTASRVGFKTERKLRVFQKDAYYSIDMHNKTLKIYRKTGDSAKLSQDDISIEEHSSGDADALMMQSKAFLNSITGGEPAIVSGRVGMQALETALEIARMVKSQ